ncbi:hypothetical protein K1X84_09955 [bacterium]|nr:hypothetical protein [bacterium]
MQGIPILLISFLTGILSCGENDSPKYTLDGTQWKVTQYNDQAVLSDEYIRFNGDRMQIWYKETDCYEKDYLNLTIENGELLADIDDLDSAVQLHYSIQGNTLTIDFTAYEVQYVSSDFDPSSFKRCQ